MDAHNIMEILTHIMAAISRVLNSRSQDILVSSARLAILIVFVLTFPGAVFGQLTLQTAPDRIPALLLDGKPVLAYGPSPQNILTFLPSGNGNDYQDWADWAEQFDIRNVRSYPPSIIVAPPALNLFEHADGRSGKFDLTRFNDAYFQALRQACKRFKRAGIIVHLQLWQAVYWKKKWQHNYYNPANNINPDISSNAGPGEFSTTVNPLLLSHQAEYVRHVLDATADIGNVFYDIMNEIGNGTSASRDWVEHIIDVIDRWEIDAGFDVLLTLNDEGGLRLDDFSISYPRLDLAVKDLGRYDEHVETRLRFSKPTVSVRNIDFNYSSRERFYFFKENNLEINADPGLQSRGRRYWWRMYMAGAVSAGGYSDSVLSTERSSLKRFASKALRKIGQPDLFPSRYEISYRLDTLSETNFYHFRKFIDIAGHPFGLYAISNIHSGHPVANSYCLQNEEKAIIYLESPNGESGHHYPSLPVQLNKLSLLNGTYRLIIYLPENGKRTEQKIMVHQSAASVRLPEFLDDLAMLIQNY